MRKPIVDHCVIHGMFGSNKVDVLQIYVLMVSIFFKTGNRNYIVLILEMEKRYNNLY